MEGPGPSCKAGYYCLVASGDILGYTTEDPYTQLCEPGYYCPEGIPDHMPCVSSYTDLYGADICKDCPGGYTCTTTSRTMCHPELDSLRSFYCPQNLMDLVYCNAGTYNVIPGSSSSEDCVDCPPGYYCPNSDAATDKILPCSAGFFCSLGAADDEGDGPCGIGYYCPEASSHEIPCDKGHYCDVAGLDDTDIVTKLCRAGYYCKSKATTDAPIDGVTGWKCPTGYYCPEGTLSPIACPVGTYKSVSGSPGGNGLVDEDCTACPEGMFCDVRGLSNPMSQCPAG
jgi:hypothetical protein